MKNLQQHRGSKKCKPVPMDSEPYDDESVNSSAPLTNDEEQFSDDDEAIETGGNEEVYKCRDCETEFTNVQALSDHVQQFHQDESSSDEDEVPPTVYRCGQCDNEYSTLPALQAHRRTCHPDTMQDIKEMCNNFNCDEC